MHTKRALLAVVLVLASVPALAKEPITHEDVWQQQSLFAELTPATQSRQALSEDSPRYLAPLHEASAERLKRLQELSDAFRDRRAD